MAKRKVFSIGNSLSDGLEQTIASAHNYSSDLRVDVIPLKKIETDPQNPRSLEVSLSDVLNGIASDDPLKTIKLNELESLQSLANSISEQGIINPIIVYEFNGVYRLIAGERRTLASALAKKVDIQAKILDGRPNELKIRILQWIENIERADLSLTERMDNLEKITNAFAKENNILPKDIKVTEISQLIGCVKSHASNLKAVLHADDKIRLLISSNKINSLEKAALLSNIQSENLREHAIEECVKGASLKQLRTFLEQDKAKPIVVKSPKSSGRKTTKIHFGSTTSVNVAKIVLDSIFKNSMLSNITNNLSAIDDNPRMLAQTFKLVIEKLEQIHE